MDVVIFSTTYRKDSEALERHIRSIKNKGGVIWTSPYSYLVQRECLKQGILPKILTPGDLYSFRSVVVYHYIDNSKILYRIGLREEAEEWVARHTKNRNIERRGAKGVTKHVRPPWSSKEEILSEDHYASIESLVAFCSKYGIQHIPITEL